MIRFLKDALVRSIAPALALGAAALLGLLIVAVVGHNPFAVVRNLLSAATQAHGLRDDIAYVLLYATPLIFTGLSVAVAFRAGLFNIGGMGQIMVGSILCGWAGWKLAALPAILAIPACIALAALGGALWGAIAGALKAWRGSHEVIITIMLNFCAIAVTDSLANGTWKAKEGMTPQLPAIGQSARLPRLGARAADAPPPEAGDPPLMGIGLFPKHVQVNASLFLALLAAAGMHVFLFRTVRGYELRAVGHNPEAARAAGISVKRVTITAMAISGALAGLAATDLVMGTKYNYRQDDAMSYARAAFIGIAVSLMGQNHPGGIILAALLFGAMERMGLLLNDVPKDIVLILQAAVILFVICGNELFSRMLARKAATT
ncbi:MAG: ABC transporter permease [Planctomycetota bacterium]